ncbi:hypothetical protein [Fibrobacter sp.]|uniref:hypothetical protein n=1 Tax=Fibrobacter sp. TaxID=35828 RepID=UPI001B1AADAD|nr:hypothetical protein [Fibrobacter sp.]MBO7060877.1 hypothetical protein [Fibrobacter sp.]MBO7104164.1 hypothetical protein [Fibrobacter sp.]
MKLSHICLLVLGIMLLWGCSNRSSSPILIERGVGQNEYEREYFAIKESMGIDKRLKDVFKQGYIEEGMTNDMVNLLWGPPDHESETDTSSVWEYYTREGKLITRLIWKHPDQARLKGYENEWILNKIEGDRYGGSPAPTSNRSSNYN